MYPVFLFLFRYVLESLSTSKMEGEDGEASTVVVFKARFSRSFLSMSDSPSSSSSDLPTAAAHYKS